jgi:hypothetical protein
VVVEIARRRLDPSRFQDGDDDDWNLPCRATPTPTPPLPQSLLPKDKAASEGGEEKEVQKYLDLARQTLCACMQEYDEEQVEEEPNFKPNPNLDFVPNLDPNLREEEEEEFVQTTQTPLLRRKALLIPSLGTQTYRNMVPMHAKYPNQKAAQGTLGTLYPPKGPFFQEKKNRVCPASSSSASARSAIRYSLSAVCVCLCVLSPQYLPIFVPGPRSGQVFC